MIAKLKALSSRLRRDGPISAADRGLLAEYREEHTKPKNVAEEVVRSLPAVAGASVTSRLKNAETLIEKLRREGSRLRGLRDIAGVRVVCGGGRARQDQIIAELRSSFPRAESVDRVGDPRAGYRAKHLVVDVGKYRVEVQVRTRYQDLWAQFFESLGDRWGRQIRYGRLPDAPRSTIKIRGAAVTRVEAVSLFRDLSDEVADVEAYEYELQQRAAGRLVALAGDADDRYPGLTMVRERGLYDATTAEVADLFRDIDDQFRAFTWLMVSSPERLIELGAQEEPDRPAHKRRDIHPFVVLYRRHSGEYEVRRYESEGGATQARRELEELHAGDQDIEVVPLWSESEEQLRRTHARFFGKKKKPGSLF